MSKIKSGMETGPTSEEGVSSGSGPGASSPERRAGRVGVLRKYFVNPLITSANPPWFDARGVAVGLILGLGCPIGAQTIMLALLRVCFRFNVVIAFAFTWVNNPLTLLPMYYGYYYAGSLLLGRPAIMSADAFQQLMQPVLAMSYFWAVCEAFMSLGWEFLVRWTVTAAIVAVVSGIAGYVAAYRVQKTRCSRKARLMGISYESLVHDLEKRMRERGDTQR